MRGAGRILHQQEAVGKRNTKGARLSERKTPRGSRGVSRKQQKVKSVRRFVLRLGRSCMGCGLGGRLLLRRGTAFHRIGLVVEADDVLGDVNLGRGEKNGRV